MAFLFDELGWSEQHAHRSVTRGLPLLLLVLGLVLVPAPAGQQARQRTEDRVESPDDRQRPLDEELGVQPGHDHGQDELGQRHPAEQQREHTAEEQYAEWRRLLHELYREETGLVPTVPAAPAADAQKPAAQSSGAG